MLLTWHLRYFCYTYSVIYSSYFTLFSPFQLRTPHLWCVWCLHNVNPHHNLPPLKTPALTTHWLIYFCNRIQNFEKFFNKFYIVKKLQQYYASIQNQKRKESTIKLQLIVGIHDFIAQGFCHMKTHKLTHILFLGRKIYEKYDNFWHLLHCGDFLRNTRQINKNKILLDTNS